MENKKVQSSRYSFLERDNDIANILMSSGKSRGPADFPILHFYLQDSQTYPFIKSYTDVQLNYIEFMKDFEKYIKKEIFIRETYEEKTDIYQIESGFYMLSKGYFAEINISYQSLDDYSSILRDFLKSLSKKENFATVGYFMLYCPPNDSPLKNIDLEKQLSELIKKHKLSRNETDPRIGMICHDDGDYYMKDFYIKKDYSLIDADLHYGEGFLSFHEKLIQRFKDDSKGLILFHGEPGTGKTYYIRSLMKELLKMGKYIIYLPPSMVSNLIDPNMMNFLSSTVMEKSENGQSCILLLEDAEPLLSSRKTENRSTGITNLLNITDGILNDMLSIQVIATFNTNLSNIDEALLRPERLVARKEFKLLKKEDAQKLIDKLNIDFLAESSLSLASIYSMEHKREILIHEYSSDIQKRIGFK